MRPRTKLLVAAVALAPLTLCVGCLWSPLDSVTLTAVPELAAPLRTKAEHDRLYSKSPYRIEVEQGTGRAVVLGLRHTNTASDPHIAALREQFATFAPTLVLVEGRLGWHLGGSSSLLGSFGESGEAVALAHDAGITHASMEPDFAAEVEDAVAAFGKQKTLAFYTLRVFVSERDQGLLGADLDGEATALLHKRAARTGIADAFADLAAFDAFWRAEGLPGVDWRKLPAKALWRNPDGAWPKQLAERINRFRDRYFVAAIAQAVRAGERVLAVCGKSHAILFEPALRAALR